MTEAARYEMLETLGKGGFGTVYRARFVGESGFSKDVAVKLLNRPTADADEIAKRLRDEARVLGLIRHRAVVQVDRLVRLGGRWAVVMELVDGIDLKTVVSVRGTMPPGPAVEVVGEVAGALHHAFVTLGPDGAPLRLLHRDIKPSNVRITASGDVKVLDFGVARADFETREAVTRSLVFGSLQYMSPERLDFVDSAGGDVYALGAVLFELLVGRPLGKTSSNVHRHLRLRDRAVREVRDALGVAGDSLAELLAELLAYDAATRPSARDLERQCGRLAPLLGSERFRDWAEREVPRIRAAVGPVEPGDMAGRELVTEDFLIPEPDSLVSRHRGRRSADREPQPPADPSAGVARDDDPDGTVAGVAEVGDLEDEADAPTDESDLPPITEELLPDDAEPTVHAAPAIAISPPPGPTPPAVARERGPAPSVPAPDVATARWPVGPASGALPDVPMFEDDGDHVVAVERAELDLLVSSIEIPPSPRRRPVLAVVGFAVIVVLALLTLFAAVVLLATMSS